MGQIIDRTNPKERFKHEPHFHDLTNWLVRLIGEWGTTDIEQALELAKEIVTRGQNTYDKVT